jgi:hypothetical protein
MRAILKISCLSLAFYILASIAFGTHCLAQAVPDTTLNHFAFDTTERARLKATDTTQMPAPVKVATVTEDTTGLLEKKKGPFQPNPKKAGLFSAIVPGLGQLYDRQYWKIPVIYVGAGVAGYFISTNLKNYQNYRKAYISSISNGGIVTGQYAGIYSQAQLKQLQDDYEKYLDLSVLFTGVAFAAQIVDAVVYAHLHNFDISQDISMKFRPVILPQGGAGLGITFNYKYPH